MSMRAVWKNRLFQQNGPFTDVRGGLEANKIRFECISRSRAASSPTFRLAFEELSLSMIECVARTQVFVDTLSYVIRAITPLSRSKLERGKVSGGTNYDLIRPKLFGHGHLREKPRCRGIRTSFSLILMVSCTPTRSTCLAKDRY